MTRDRSDMHCAINDRRCSTAYTHHACRCVDCKEWRKLTSRASKISAKLKAEQYGLRRDMTNVQQIPLDIDPERSLAGEPDVTEVSGVSEHRITSLAQLYDFFEIPFEWVHGTDCACVKTIEITPVEAGPFQFEGATIEIAGDQCPDKVPVSATYDVTSFRINSWEQHSVKRGVVTLYQVRATLVPKGALDSPEVIQGIWDDAMADFEKRCPAAKRVGYLMKPPVLKDPDNPQMLEIALMDPHLGMLAWAKEVDNDYDMEIGLTDYKRAFSRLLAMASHYNIEQILFLVGNDLFHVDAPGIDPKGGSRGGATSKGTMQDFDTRLARMFTKVRRLIVECIEDALYVAPTTVQIVPGNHDRHTMYKFGEVIDAWFRHDENLNVRNPASVRDYFLYGGNLFMFTHGEEFKRKRDNLVSVFATECPPELWVEGKIREVHVGHNHINMEKLYTGEPYDLIWEGRATRVRSLPGLTPEDAWHYESGYKHQRRGTALVWHREGGLAGLHEFTL